MEKRTQAARVRKLTWDVRDLCRSRPSFPSLMAGRGQCTLDKLGELGAVLSGVAGLAQFGERILQLPLGSQGRAEVVVGLGEVGLEPYRRPEFGDRVLQLPDFNQGGAEVEVGFGVAGL